MCVKWFEAWHWFSTLQTSRCAGFKTCTWHVFTINTHTHTNVCKEWNFLKAALLCGSVCVCLSNWEGENKKNLHEAEILLMKGNEIWDQSDRETLPDQEKSQEVFPGRSWENIAQSLYKVPTANAYYTFISEWKKVFNFVFYTPFDNVSPGFCSGCDLTNLVRKQLLSKINLVETWQSYLTSSQNKLMYRMKAGLQNNSKVMSSWEKATSSISNAWALKHRGTIKVNSHKIICKILVKT